MRLIIGSVLAASALVGCASQDTVALEHRAELTTQTRGVEMADNGAISSVGMFGTTCSVTTDFAVMQDDFDYDGDDDAVVDASDSMDGFASLVITTDHVNLTTPFRFPVQTEVTVVGVLEARFVDEGFVAVEVPPSADGDCNVVWYDADGNVQTGTYGLGVECDQDSDMTVDTSSGTTWVSTDSGVVRVSPDGSLLTVDDTANARLEWDPAANALYLGAEGDSTVRALELDGALRWEVALDGEITALSHMGAEASAAVSILGAAGGELVVIDGTLGTIQADLPTPSAANALEVSGDGRVMAVTLQNSVHYFDVLATQ